MQRPKRSWADPANGRASLTMVGRLRCSVCAFVLTRTSITAQTMDRGARNYPPTERRFGDQLIRTASVDQRRHQPGRAAHGAQQGRRFRYAQDGGETTSALGSSGG